MHYALGAEFAMRLTQARSRLEEMRAIATDLMRDAAASDAMENASWVIPTDSDDNLNNVFGNGF
jgi:hypothetical protein